MINRINYLNNYDFFICGETLYRESYKSLPILKRLWNRFGKFIDTYTNVNKLSYKPFCEYFYTGTIYGLNKGNRYED